MIITKQATLTARCPDCNTIIFEATSTYSTTLTIETRCPRNHCRKWVVLRTEVAGVIE